MAAVSDVLLIKVVVREAPFHCTTELLMKRVPETVSGNRAAPAVALLGESELATGTGFGALIVKVSALEVPPPGWEVKTVTWAVPPKAISLARIPAVNEVL